MEIYLTKDTRLARPKTKASRMLFICSLLLHAAIVACVFMSWVNTKQSIPISQTPVLKSYLYKPAVESPPIEIESQVIVPDIVEVPPDDSPRNKAPNSQAKPTTIEDLSKPSSTTNIKPTIDTIEAVVESPSRTVENADEIPPAAVLTSDSSTKSIMIEKPLQRMVSKHLQGFQDDYSQQQAREYRQRKISPTINTQTAVDTFLPVEIAPDVTVDCGNIAKKVLANVSQFTAGRVKCRTSNQFQSFIDKRLGKPAVNDENKTEGK